MIGNVLRRVAAAAIVLAVIVVALWVIVLGVELAHTYSVHHSGEEEAVSVTDR